MFQGWTESTRRILQDVSLPLKRISFELSPNIFFLIVLCKYIPYIFISPYPMISFFLV